MVDTNIGVESTTQTDKAEVTLNEDEAVPQTPSAQAATGVPTSGLGIAGLVLGILAVPPAFVPLVNFLTVPLAVVGLVLAAVGLSGIKKGRAKGKGIAIAGVVLSLVAIGVFALMYMGAGAASSAVNSAASGTQPAEQSQSSDAPEQTTAGAAEPEYSVKIGKAALGEDYSGNPAVIVEYEWTNNSDEAASFMSSLSAKVFQDGVELDTAIGVDGSDSSGYMKQVKPGKGTSFSFAYELDNKKDDVEVEVGPLINLNDEVYASKTFSIK